MKSNSNTQNLILRKVATAIIYLLAIALSIKSFREPDLWWQIRTGEWILENGKVPMYDVFSFTRESIRWINIKWLSEVFAALITKVFGPEAVVMLQAIVSALMVFFLLKWAKLFSRNAQQHLVAGLVVFFPFLLGSEYRMTGRPEMYSHLFTIVFSFLYTRNIYKNDKLIWLIVPLQILWANLHEAFAIGIVISGIFTVAFFIGNLIKGDDQKRAFLLLAITIISILATLVNPNGIDLLLRPLEIFGQLEANKYTTELVSISNAQFWKKEAWIAVAFLIVIIAYVGIEIKRAKASSLSKYLSVPIIAYAMLLIAFAYLAASAYRNIIFLLIILYPAVVFILSDVINLLTEKRPKLERRIFVSIIAAGLIGYGLIVSNKWYELNDSRDTFGMEVSCINNPVGAAQFLKDNKVDGKIFSDYLTSSYLLWKLQPDYRTFIDLRDLDVFSDTSFTDFSAMVQFPDFFEQQDSIYQFNGVVLFRPEFAALHDHLYNSGKWKTVFADAVAVIYLRDSSKSEFDFSFCGESTSSRFSTIINQVFNPFYKRYSNREVFDQHRIAASYFLTVRDFDKAITHATSAVESGGELDVAYTVLGDVYYNKSMASGNEEENAALLQSAFQAYQQAIFNNSDYALARLGLGAVHFQNQNYRAAVEQFDLGIKSNPKLLNLYLIAAQAYGQLMATDNTANDMVLKYYKAADKLNPENPFVLLNIATASYRAEDCGQAYIYAGKIKNVADFSIEEQSVINTILENCSGK